MTPSELKELVHAMRKLGTDTAHAEVKTSVGKLPRSLAESVSAFANGDGGIIILGLQESEGFRPAVSRPSRLQMHSLECVRMTCNHQFGLTLSLSNLRTQWL